MHATTASLPLTEDRERPRQHLDLEAPRALEDDLAVRLDEQQRLLLNRDFELAVVRR